MYEVLPPCNINIFSSKDIFANMARALAEGDWAFVMALNSKSAMHWYTGTIALALVRFVYEYKG